MVYIGSVNTEHVKICKMMFEGGKHVLCEKPLAINVRETKEIISAAKKNKVRLDPITKMMYDTSFRCEGNKMIPDSLHIFLKLNS